MRLGNIASLFLAIAMLFLSSPSWGAASAKITPGTWTASPSTTYSGAYSENVAWTVPLTISDNSGLLATSITAANIYIKSSTTAAPACNAGTAFSTYTYSYGSGSSYNTNSYITITPSSPYASGSYYTICVTGGSSGIKTNTSSNYMSTNPASKSFQVRDYAAPYVSSVSPAIGGVTSNTSPGIAITFSEPMATSSVTTGSVSLQDNLGTAVSLSGPVWTSSNKVATFTPSTPLTSMTTYTVSLDGSQTDTSSNLIDCSGHVCGWMFTVDNTAPLIANNSPDTAFVNTTSPAISVTFSETMLASSITTSTITVMKGATAVGGSWSLSGDAKTATFTPSSALVDGSTYTCTATTGVKDLAGNAVANPKTWTFTVDATAPRVASYTPVAAAIGIGLTTPITITFTEANSGMKTSTFTTANITVNNGTRDLGWTYTYDSTAKKLNIIPTGGFDYGTIYTVTLNNTVTDVAGNPINCSSGAFTGGVCSWNFTTTALTGSDYSAYPSFMCGTSQPNVLIVLDNSNSMDEDMVGNAVGSPKCSDPSDLGTCSRSVIARMGLMDTINAYSDKMRIGIMSFKLPTSSKQYLHNSYYFSSFDRRSYCPNPPAACADYCINGSLTTPGPSTNRADCNTGCQAQNLSFDATYMDALLTSAGTGGANGTTAGSAERKSYCSLIYPKTNAYTDANGVTVYGGTPGTLYSGSNEGIRYLYSSGYNSTRYPSNTDSYYSCTSHTGTTDSTAGYAGCSGPYGFVPTDDDFALGFYDFGARNYWYYTSRTWFANSSPGGGYLHVPVTTNDTSNVHRDALLTKLGRSGTGGNAAVDGFRNDETGYMACTSTSDPNTCSYIVNAGLTPTNGTLTNATQYFKGALTQGGTTYATPIQFSCQKNYIIFVTDGAPSVNSSGATGTASSLIGDVVTTIKGLSCPTLGATADNCKFVLGGNTYDIKTYILGVALNANNKTLINSMAAAGGTTPYYGDSLSSFNTAIASIFGDILANAESGTAASILNNSQGSGASLLQAMFYPMKSFGSASNAYWIGEMHSLWYYIDTALNNISIREDTNSDNRLDLHNDNIVNFYFDSSQGKTFVNTFKDVNGNGSTLTSVNSAMDPDNISSLWRAGRKLWERNLSSDPRTVYTGFNSTRGATPQLFSSATSDGFANSSSVWSLMQIPAGTNTYRTTKAQLLVDYIKGADQLSSSDPDGQEYRSRTVPITGCGLSDSQGCSREWKLGDIVSSTPRLVSNLALGTYSLANPTGYNDRTYSAFVSSSTYKTRGMVFVGANDGMLHAFRLGTLKELGGKYLKAEFDDYSGNLATSSTKLGREEWAYIPTSSLPYLKYYAESGYNHLFYVDRTPSIVDASIGVPTGCSGDYYGCTKSQSTWRTVLLGGTGFGGASRISTDSCNSTTTVNSVSIPNCVISPISTGGLSSYFALDVTDPANPAYLWEFSGSKNSGAYVGDLGAATSGPAIIRLAYRNGSGNADNEKNGRWFAVFASGPTGPIYSSYHRFMGQSDQNLKVFIVDLADGTLVRTIDTGISNAYAGSLSTNAIDTDRFASTNPGFYSDDAVYIGYTRQCVSGDTGCTLGEWTKGGVLRLTTSDWIDPNGTNTSTGNPYWNLSTLIDGIGPVTTSVAKLQDRDKKTMWLYFGTGRFYYNGDESSFPNVTQALYGLKEPCYSTATRNIASFSPKAGGTLNHIDGTCNSTLSAGSLVNQSGSATSPPNPTIATTAPGWFVNLEPADTTNGFLTERLISDPTASSAGTVYFTTFIPNSSPCQFGGNTYIWALNYSTGSTPAPATMKGTALVQVSTGAFQQVSLATAFTSSNSRFNGRRTTSPITGVPPISQGLSLITNPPPVKKIIQVREK